MKQDLRLRRAGKRTELPLAVVMVMVMPVVAAENMVRGWLESLGMDDVLSLLVSIAAGTLVVLAIVVTVQRFVKRRSNR